MKSEIERRAFICGMIWAVERAHSGAEQDAIIGAWWPSFRGALEDKARQWLVEIDEAYIQAISKMEAQLKP